MGEQTLPLLGALQDDSFDASIHLGRGVEPNVGHLVRHGVVALMANARQHRDRQFADGTHEGIVIELGHVVDDTTTAMMAAASSATPSWPRRSSAPSSSIRIPAAAPSPWKRLWT